MPAYLIVRAEVVDAADRDAFDRWYETEHLPDAHAAFETRSAWRGWSDVEPQVHYAFYEFDTLAAAKALLDSPAIRRSIAEFDRVWGERVTRSRDIVERIQTVPG